MTLLPSGLDLSFQDPAIRPQDDLFRHFSGTWLRTAEIPADRPIDGGFRQLRDRAEEHVRAIIEEVSAGSEADDRARRIGDLYASFMDEARIESLGVAPLRPDLERIEAVEDLGQLLHLIGSLQRQGVGGLAAFFVDNDDRDPESYVVNLWQGGLGLPDESYYREDQHETLRAQYRAHVARTLELAGVVSAADADDAATRVFAVEAALAAHHWDRVKCREADLTYNRMSRSDLEALSPAVPWTAWLEGADVPATAIDPLVVRQPSFVAGLGEVLTGTSLADWRLWLSWHLVHDTASLLHDALVAENFAFYGTTLSGTPQIRDRWKRGVALVEGAMGEAVGALYVERHFPPQAKERMLDLVANLIEAYRRSITSLEWMGPQTRERALDKLAKFTPKIGYPDQFRDYSGLHIDRADLVGNARRAASFEWQRNLDKLGRPVDRSEWFMTPQTVNAYYNPGMNEIVFPAAILQPPFFGLDADDAVNYGGIGAVIGHEIGHGFDDQGSKYDGDGNLENWWTDADRAEFEKRTGSLIAQYDALEPAEVPGHTVNGAFTIGENIGDLGGLGIAWQAYLLSLGGREAPEVDGFSAAQRFFLGWAQVWRTKVRPEQAKLLLQVDPHSPAEFRCNQVVRNLDEFHEAFGTTEADALWLHPAERVRIW